MAAKRGGDRHPLVDLDETTFPALISSNDLRFVRKGTKTELGAAVDRKISGDDRSGDGLGFVPLDKWNSMKPTARKMMAGVDRNGSGKLCL
ncbi:hypothetical protein TIFTF001_042711 [Ficus carica]|uniref:Uncharacterized protein n=1 Tax=Ficus carica TaxID=3494 RepID=A0AA88A5W9_FICCA|nr:hypothetical protein TIFTF001_042711 [Ficus carica]